MNDDYCVLIEVKFSDKSDFPLNLSTTPDDRNRKRRDRTSPDEDQPATKRMSLPQTDPVHFNDWMGNMKTRWSDLVYIFYRSDKFIDYITLINNINFIADLVTI